MSADWKFYTQQATKTNNMQKLKRREWVGGESSADRGGSVIPLFWGLGAIYNEETYINK